jgi:hypothetical protein
MEIDRTAQRPSLRAAGVGTRRGRLWHADCEDDGVKPVHFGRSAAKSCFERGRDVRRERFQEARSREHPVRRARSHFDRGCVLSTRRPIGGVGNEGGPGVVESERHATEVQVTCKSQRLFPLCLAHQWPPCECEDPMHRSDGVRDGRQPIVAGMEVEESPPDPSGRASAYHPDPIFDPQAARGGHSQRCSSIGFTLATATRHSAS